MQRDRDTIQEFQHADTISQSNYQYKFTVKHQDFEEQWHFIISN